jgi:anti-sigma factor RsiW
MTHQQINELLPWYANGTLAGEERREVEQHLGTCRECARACHEFRALGRVTAELDAEIPEMPAGMLADALRQIDALARPQVARLSLWQRLAEWWLPMPVFARAALAVQFVLILGLGALLIGHRGTYQVAGGEGPAAERGVRIAIQFQPTATEADIRQLLTQQRASIVSGPSAQGLYVIATPVQPTDQAALDRLVQALRTRTAVVRYAERQP